MFLLRFRDLRRCQLFYLRGRIMGEESLPRQVTGLGPSRPEAKPLVSSQTSALVFSERVL
jgi:hypothetical protein